MHFVPYVCYGEMTKQDTIWEVPSTARDACPHQAVVKITVPRGAVPFFRYPGERYVHAYKRTRTRVFMCLADMHVVSLPRQC